MANIHLSKATLLNKRWISSKVLELNFEPQEPFAFEPGQFITIQVDEKSFRTYSIAGDPNKKTILTIIADAKHEGKAANFFRNIDMGEAIVYLGPRGRFRGPIYFKETILMLCTGTGLAPFIPMLHDMLESGCDAKIRMYFGVKTEDQIFYRDLLEQFKLALPNFEYNICLSQPSDGWTGERGRISDYYSITAPEKTQVVLCGNPHMVEEGIEYALNVGVSEEDIFTEKFTHAKN